MKEIIRRIKLNLNIDFYILFRVFIHLKKRVEKQMLILLMHLKHILFFFEQDTTSITIEYNDKGTDPRIKFRRQLPMRLTLASARQRAGSL